MVENVQCPVCTLFLHAGMNLSDHLETHPKEQVIKALVQMTISGNGPVSALTALTGGDGSVESELEDNAKLASEKEHDVNSRCSSASSISSPSESTATSCSSNNSGSFANTNYPMAQKQLKIGNETALSAAASRSEVAGSVASTEALAQTSIATHAYQRDDANVLPADFSALSLNRYQHQHYQQQQATTGQKAKVQPQQHVGVAQQQRAKLPPPPLPPPLPAQLTNTFQVPPLQHVLLATKTTTSHFQSHVHHHHHHQQQQHQHHAQQSNLKIIYTPTIAPPPPLQLFYQAPPQPQHQKPPPAYGTAISQIRSQHNQNKLQVSPTAAAAAAACQPHQQQLRAVAPPTNSMAKHVFQSKQAELASAATTSSHAVHRQPHQLQQQHIGGNISNVATNQLKSAQRAQTEAPTTTTEAVTAIKSLPTASSVSRLSSLSPSAGSIVPPTSASPSNSSSLNLAMSPSSVLRYAESPVAHYLERDNGDFILQETPKHIVECIEKENGEFSVIERLYQSPPSVLHIHDDDDENDDDDGGVDGGSNDDDDRQQAEDKQDSNKEDDSFNEDDEFLSITSDSDHEERVAATSKHKARGSKHAGVSSGEYGSKSNTNNDNATKNTSISGSLSTLSLSSSSSSSSLSSSSTSSTSSTISNASSAPRKKSTKNTITVLSDVQLNLNEYLDLVGNIMASSKVTSGQPVKLCPKVKKEEPMDEDEFDATSAIHNQEQFGQSTETATATTTTTTTTTNKPPINANNNNNKNETDEEVVEHNYSNTKSSVKRSSETNKAAVDEKRKNLGNEQAICSSHVTSVIRMASTSQQQSPQQQHQLEVISSSDKFRATLKQHLKHAEDLSSQTHSKTEQQSEQSSPQTLLESLHHDAEEFLPIHRTPIHPLPPAPPLISTPTKKGPKKLVIKPKSTTKTDANANNSTTSTGGTVEAAAEAPPAPAKVRAIAEERPSTSAMAQRKLVGEGLQRQKQQQHQQQPKQKQQQQKSLPQPHYPLAPNIVIKTEPNACGYESNNASGGSILEQQLKLGLTMPTPMLECKREISQTPQNDFLLLAQQQQQQQQQQQHGIRSSSSSAARTPPHLKAERTAEMMHTAHSHVAEDARVLLEFANSKKHVASATANAANFPSSSSIFNADANVTKTSAASTQDSVPELIVPGSCEDEFIGCDAGDVVQEVVISSYSSQSASAQGLDDIINSAAAASTTSAEHQHPQALQHQHQQHQQHSFNDYSFGFLYAGNVATSQQFDTKPSFYQPPHDVAPSVAAATCGSSSSSVTIEDSTSEHAMTPQQQQQPPPHHHHYQPPSAQRFVAAAHCTVPQWYHHANTAANSDFAAALGVDCNNAALDGGDVGRYLDLDACKREHNNSGLQAAPSSSTSSSFTLATESSLAGGCTTDALNIRTDEKMPAKGEISEQESNCDIENSWSQPMYGDMSARFFKTSFPGIFQQEQHGWNHDDYFGVQDLSATTTGAANASNRPSKSFDFRLPLEAVTTVNNSNLHLFPQHNDIVPSTSSTATHQKKKRSKRDLLHVNKSPIKRLQPTATISSAQQLLLQKQLQQTLQQGLQSQPQHGTTAAAAALMAGPSNAATVGGTSALTTAMLQPKPRNKIYHCVHCPAEFSKLKDRNSHMIKKHDYVRQNRRLICTQAAAAASLSAATNNATSTITTADLAGVAAAAGGGASSSSNAYHILRNESDCMENKQGIVKIEVEASEPLMPLPIMEDINARAAFPDDDEKNGLSLALASYHGPSTQDNNSSVSVVETKPLIQPLAVTTPATKLATLYRMLISYNMSTLKQNSNLSELEEKVIESSIFFCYICRQNFTSVKLYDQHLTEHPAECFTCGKKFQRWKNFSLHLKRHLGWKEFGCNVCDKKFVVRSALVEHMRMHTGHTPLKCKICGKNFKRYSNLTQHRKRHSAQIVRKKEYVCHCGEVLPSKARFLWHKETHDAKPKCCPYCCDRFVHANSLRRHIRLAHSDKFDYTEPMECPMCKQIFAKSSIKAHMATHSVDTQYDCAICSKSFSTKWNLKIHSWVHANRTAKPFKCEHCPKAFVREVDFKNHINAHKQIKPYTCEYCGCKFIRKYNYMRHRREHHGNKKFTCDLCKKSFHRHYYLIEHRRIHTGERPFQCTICGKSSTTKTNHNKHLKIHHSRDPFTVEA